MSWLAFWRVVGQGVPLWTNAIKRDKRNMAPSSGIRWQSVQKGGGRHFGQSFLTIWIRSFMLCTGWGLFDARCGELVRRAVPLDYLAVTWRNSASGSGRLPTRWVGVADWVWLAFLTDMSLGSPKLPSRQIDRRERRWSFFPLHSFAPFSTLKVSGCDRDINFVGWRPIWDQRLQMVEREA